jgi:hypothetical protein
MAALATINQQPNDKRDYDINFSEWFPEGDYITEASVSVLPLGLTVGYAMQAPIVKVWVQGGVSGVTYKITVLASTNDGRSKEVELKAKIKDF